MKYKEAMAIGSAVDGIIKCTWATIYNESGEKQFTIQAKDGVVLRQAMEGVNDTLNVDLVQADDKMYEAVCTCSRYVDGYRVPVSLSEIVVSRMQNSLAIAKQKYNNYLQRLNEEKERQINKGYETEEYNTVVDVDVRLSNWIAVYESYAQKWGTLVARREQQLADIEAGKEFWVKVKAMEWYPLNTNGVASEVQEAEAELKKAKQLLAASAALTAI